MDPSVLINQLVNWVLCEIPSTEFAFHKTCILLILLVSSGLFLGRKLVEQFPYLFTGSEDTGPRLFYVS